MFYFRKHPIISYDLFRTNTPIRIQNPLVRFKLLDILRNKTALYYTHNIEDGQTAQFIAHRYYGDDTLDWILYIVNNIIDPQYDWPLEYLPFLNFIKAKYGSVPAAQSQIHHYEQIIQNQSVLFDGTIIPEKTIIVDFTTYSSLPLAERKEVDSFTYEERLNESKRNIKILQKQYIPNFLAEAESIFE